MLLAASGTARRRHVHLQQVDLAPCRAGLSKLPHFRTYNFKLGLRSTLRQKFPPPPLGQMYAGSTPALSDAGYDLLVSLLQMCPVSRCGRSGPAMRGWRARRALRL